MDSLLKERISDICETCGFSFQICEEREKEACAELECYTPAGEDWIETLWFEPTLEGFERALQVRLVYFDVDDEAAFWIGQLGQRGVPDSVSVLLHDAEWKLDSLDGLHTAASTARKAAEDATESDGRTSW